MYFYRENQIQSSISVKCKGGDINIERTELRAALQIREQMQEGGEGGKEREKEEKVEQMSNH